MNDADRTCQAYKCPQCRGVSLRIDPCGKCKVPKESYMVPVEGVRLLQSVDRLNSQMAEMQKIQNELWQTILGAVKPESDE